ncbi:MAG TPA: hypothetical protein VK968_04105, partial [Roseimicrobium sp.]|nr:hypothetical protein [Roseimicrobium sp.]
MRLIILILLACLSTAWSGTLTNQGLVAIGRVPADMLDATGKDTLGGFFSAMAVAPGSWTFGSNV